MRIGLIGLGRIGMFHAETLSALPVVSSLVVADAQPGLADEAAARFGAEAVEGPEGLLAAGVDGVVIAAATDAHPDLILAGVDAGIPVFCEKPVARSAAQASEVARRLADVDTPVQIGFQRRFDAGYMAAREAVARGDLGWLHTLRATTLDPSPPPAAYIAASGGIFRDCGVHDFDIIRWVTGHEVVEVYATGSNRGAEFFTEVGDVDTSAAVLTLDDDTLALVSNGRYNARGYDVRLELHGSLDSIAVGMEDRLPLRSIEPGVPAPSSQPHRFFMDRFLPAYRAELEAFTEVVAGKRPPACTVADAVAADWIAEACMESLQQRRPVRVEGQV
jgi:myo-inositol 2-dehydrogenase/D-chiro-inositol 1-dehydrogenase